MENGPLFWQLQFADAMYYLNPYIFVGEANYLQGPQLFTGTPTIYKDPIIPCVTGWAGAGWGQLTQGSSCCSLGHFLSFLALSTVS